MWVRGSVSAGWNGLSHRCWKAVKCSSLSGSLKQTNQQSHLLSTMIDMVCTSVKTGRAVRTNSVLHTPQITIVNVQNHTNTSASAAVDWRQCAIREVTEQPDCWLTLQLTPLHVFDSQWHSWYLLHAHLCVNEVFYSIYWSILPANAWIYHRCLAMWTSFLLIFKGSFSKTQHTGDRVNKKQT